MTTARRFQPPRRRLPLDGIVSVLNTPFDRDGAIALDALRANVSRAMEAGVVGFLVPAMASEVAHLTEAERWELLEVVTEAARGRAAVVAGCSAATSDERSSYVRIANDLGCDGVLIAAGSSEEDSLRADLESVFSLGPPFLMLQDWDAEGPGLPVDLIAALFDDYPMLRSIKIEVKDSGPKYSEVLAATSGLLHIAGGWAVTQMIDGMDRGVHAFMPTGMHEVYCEIYRRYMRNDRAGAVQLFEGVRPILEFSNRSLEISIEFFKLLLHREGLYPTSLTRIDESELTELDRQEAEQLVRDAMELTRLVSRSVV